MKKSEIFNIILDKVCEVCEVNRDDVLTFRKFQAVVDARLLATQYMRRSGLSNDDIALIYCRTVAGNNSLCPPIDELKKKAKSIDSQFNMYSARCMESYAFCMMSSEIAEFCKSKYMEYYCKGMKELPNR